MFSLLVSLVTQPIVTSATGITEIAAEQKNKAAIVIPICLALFGTLVVLALVIGNIYIPVNGKLCVSSMLWVLLFNKKFSLPLISLTFIVFLFV